MEVILILYEIVKETIRGFLDDVLQINFFVWFHLYWRQDINRLGREALVLYFILNFLTCAEFIVYGKDKNVAKIEC